MGWPAWIDAVHRELIKHGWTMEQVLRVDWAVLRDRYFHPGYTPYRAVSELLSERVEKVGFPKEPVPDSEFKGWAAQLAAELTSRFEAPAEVIEHVSVGAISRDLFDRPLSGDGQRRTPKDAATWLGRQIGFKPRPVQAAPYSEEGLSPTHAAILNSNRVMHAIRCRISGMFSDPIYRSMRPLNGGDSDVLKWLDDAIKRNVDTLRKAECSDPSTTST